MDGNHSVLSRGKIFSLLFLRPSKPPIHCVMGMGVWTDKAARVQS